MEATNGQTKKITRGHENRGAEVKRERLGSAGCSSQLDGLDQISISGKDRDWRNSDWKLTPIRDTTAGKILERLEALEAQHLEYVHSHQARLEARLGESKQSEEEFKKESNQIKSDIYHLATAQSNGNGTN